MDTAPNAIERCPGVPMYHVRADQNAERTTEPDLDVRLVRRPETRPSADLRLFARKPQISTYLRLDH
eukprot:13307-Prymnesium_polylepis.1